MKRTLICCAVIMLTLPAGMCQTTRFVKVPCLTQEQLEQRKKAEPPMVGKDLTGDAQKDSRILGGSAKELRSWGRGNLDILGGCVG
jgi:hypothetical protein